MKTLANQNDYDEILRRLRTISATSQRRWGTMIVAEMISHLNDALRVCMGDKPAASISNGFTRSVLKWAALWFPTHWPHGVRTFPELDPRLQGTPPKDIADDLSDLRALLARFTTHPEIVTLHLHPVFGPMAEKEWMRWGYLHIDHHLRQFGA
jgi:Protein of unknown function (DUF1569)